MKNIRLLIVDFAHALVPPVIVFVLFLLRVFFIRGLEQLDVLAHFSGGFSIAWMAMILWNRWKDRGWILTKTPKWLRDYAVWGTVGLVGIAWEFFEFTMDVWLGWMMQPSIADTMNDFFMDLLGGVLFLILFRIFRPRT